METPSEAVVTRFENSFAAVDSIYRNRQILIDVNMNVEMSFTTHRERSVTSTNANLTNTDAVSTVRDHTAVPIFEKCDAANMKKTPDWGWKQTAQVLRQP
jgi:hypothetical protein